MEQRKREIISFRLRKDDADLADAIANMSSAEISDLARRAFRREISARAAPPVAAMPKVWKPKR